MFGRWSRGLARQRLPVATHEMGAGPGPERAAARRRPRRPGADGRGARPKDYTAPCGPAGMAGRCVPDRNGAGPMAARRDACRVASIAGTPRGAGTRALRGPEARRLLTRRPHSRDGEHRSRGCLRVAGAGAPRAAANDGGKGGGVPAPPPPVLVSSRRELFLNGSLDSMERVGFRIPLLFRDPSRTLYTPWELTQELPGSI